MPPQIETNRLILRPFALEDIDAAYAALETHPDTWKFDPGFRRTKEQRAAIIRKYAQSNDFAFHTLRLARIVTVTQRENAPSIKLLERLGMRFAPAPAAWPGLLTATLENDRS